MFDVLPKYALLALGALLPLAAGAQQTTQPPPKVIPSERLANYWIMTNTSVDADIPNSGMNLNVPGCVTVSFVVGKDGRTSQIKVQKVAPPSDLGKVAASVAASLEFQPTGLNAGRDPVFSWLIFPFNLPPDPDARKQIMRDCAVDTLEWKDR